MNIYDEAIELENEIKENRLQLTKEKYRDLDDIKLSKIIKSKSDKHDKIIKALERAKNVEELLGLYQKSSHYQIGHNLGCLSIDDKKNWIEIEQQINLKEKELEEMKVNEKG